MAVVSTTPRGFSRPRRKIPVTRILSYLMLAVWSIVVLFPLFWMVTTAFKQQVDLFPKRLVLPWIQFTPKLTAFHYVFNDFGSQFRNAFENSLIAAGGSAILATMLGAMAGYALIRFSYKFGPWK